LKFCLDDCSIITLSWRDSGVFVCFLNNGTNSCVHYLEEEEVFSTNGYALKFNRNMVQGQKIYIRNVDEFRKRAETYIEVNDFKTCFLPEYLINDHTTKTLIQNLLPFGSRKKALVGYSYINHMKTFGFDNQKLKALCIEDHGDHENTVLILDWQKNIVYYIRISSLEKFNCQKVATELNRCNDFLKSFLLLHEAKLKGENLAVCALLAFTNITATDIDNAQFELHTHLKSFVICKDDITDREKLISKVKVLYEKVQTGRKDCGVMSKPSSVIPSKLRQILSESMATMVVVNIALPRLTNDPYLQVISLLLNKEQYEIIHHPDNHIIITGGYGCGKTLILLEIAKKLFLKQEHGEIFYICFDPFSLLPARMKEYFQVLQNEHPRSENVKLTAIGINQSDSILLENKRDLKSILEFYTNQTRGIAHFLIDEVDSEKFTEEYSKNVKDVLVGKMGQSKVVLAMQSMRKQRNNQDIPDNDKGHCFEQTGMTLLPLKKSMRMAGNIFKLKKIATESILEPTSMMIKRSLKKRKLTLPENYTTHQNRPVTDTVQKNKNLVSTTQQSLESINISNTQVLGAKEFVSTSQSSFPKPNNITTSATERNESRELHIDDTDMEMLMKISPQLFSNDANDPSVKIQTVFTYPDTENGVNVNGEKLPTIIYLNKVLGNSGVFLRQIIEYFLNDKLKICIICNSREVSCLTKYSLQILCNELNDISYTYYTPYLDSRLPGDSEKERIWQESQVNSSIFVTDHKGFRGCEAESVVTFVNQDDKYNNHVLVEILSRAVVNLCLLVLPCKSEDINVKPGSLRHVIKLWKEKQAVVEIYLKKFKFKYNRQFEDFRKEHANHSILVEDVER